MRPFPPPSARPRSAVPEPLLGSGGIEPSMPEPPSARRAQELRGPRNTDPARAGDRPHRVRRVLRQSCEAPAGDAARGRSRPTGRRRPPPAVASCVAAARPALACGDDCERAPKATPAASGHPWHQPVARRATHRGRGRRLQPGWPPAGPRTSAATDSHRLRWTAVAKSRASMVHRPVAANRPSVPGSANFFCRAGQTPTNLLIL